MDFEGKCKVCSFKQATLGVFVHCLVSINSDKGQTKQQFAEKTDVDLCGM